MNDPKKLWIGALDLNGDLDGDTMAGEIVAALAAQVPLGWNEDVLPRQKLAIAIATGVVKHLRAHAGAFHADVSDTGTVIDHPVSIEVGP